MITKYCGYCKKNPCECPELKITTSDSTIDVHSLGWKGYKCYYCGSPLKDDLKCYCSIREVHIINSSDGPLHFTTVYTPVLPKIKKELDEFKSEFNITPQNIIMGYDLMMKQFGYELVSLYNIPIVLHYEADFEYDFTFSREDAMMLLAKEKLLKKRDKEVEND